MYVLSRQERCYCYEIFAWTRLQHHSLLRTHGTNAELVSTSLPIASLNTMSPFQLDPVYKYAQSIYPSMLTGIIGIGVYPSAYVVLHVSDTSPRPLAFDVSFGLLLPVSRLSHMVVRYRPAWCPDSPQLKHKPFRKNFLLYSNAVMAIQFSRWSCFRKCILALISLPFVYSSVSQTSLAGRRWSVYCFSLAISV